MVVIVLFIIVFLALVCFVVSLMIIVFTFGRFVHPFAPLSSAVIKILMTLHVPSDNCLTVRGIHPNMSKSSTCRSSPCRHMPSYQSV